MNGSTIINTWSNILDADFKAEVFAAGMIENGVSPEKIIIQMLGAAKRSYRKDVEEIAELETDYDRKEYIHIRTHKEGIYDKLPEALFHSPSLPGNAKTEKEVVKAFKKYKEEEEKARTFFLPFEAAINDRRIQLALQENLLDIRVGDSKLVDIFASHWEIFKYLNARQSNIFMFLLPLLHSLRGNLDMASRIFELILEIEVSIVLQPQPTVHNDEPIYSSLADTRLGVDLSTGNAVFETGDDEILVCVGPMNQADFDSFLPGKKNAVVLEQLCHYFLPVHLDIRQELILEDADKQTKLYDHNSASNTNLGLDTYL